MNDWEGKLLKVLLGCTEQWNTDSLLFVAHSGVVQREDPYILPLLKELYQNDV